MSGCVGILFVCFVVDLFCVIRLFLVTICCGVHLLILLMIWFGFEVYLFDW